MSNDLYGKARERFAKAQIDWLNDNIKVAVLSPSYPGGSTALANDEYYSSIASYVLTGTQPIKTLTSKVTHLGSSPNIIYGALSAAAVTFTSLTANQTVGFIAVFKDLDPTNTDGPPSSGNAASSPLIGLFDSGYGIGQGTNGNSIQITWHPTQGMFQL